MIQRQKNNPKNEDTVVPCNQRNSRQEPSCRMFASVFWDKDGILLVDYLEKGATIKTKNCIALLDKLKQHPFSKG
jgi:hypothetical protein